jgi:hypothetical protein
MIRVRLRTLLAVALLAGLTGCGSSGGPGLVTPATTAPVDPDDPAGLLASRAAAALDQRYVAAYRYTPAGGPPRTVTVLVALDGTWRVDIPHGAMSGTVDVSVVRTDQGLYQCQLGANAICVKVAGVDGRLGASIDPKVEHIFVDWLSVLTDREQAISVAKSQNLPGSTGLCFSVQPSAASLNAPMDPGILCYDDDGTLTAAVFTWGSVRLTADPVAAPPTTPFPGPVVPGEPLPLIAPPTPP